MTRIRIIPVLLMHKGGLYKTMKFKHPVYVGDPMNTVKIFNDKEADELMLLGYRASKENTQIDFDLIASVAGEAFMPMSYGGGIRNFDDAKKVFKAGFEKVVLNSALFGHPDIAHQIADTFGSQAVIASVDVKKDIWGKYKVFSDSGSINRKISPENWIKKLIEVGVGEILVNSIDRDGTWQGYDTELISILVGKIDIPLIACGGAGKLEDLRLASEAGASAVAAGSMFVFKKKGQGVLVSFPSEDFYSSSSNDVN